MKVSIIIPTLNEARCIEENLRQVQALRREGHEVILVDGGSADETVAVARPLVDQLISGAPGRARQMNLGAHLAKGQLLWFLHADTRAPADAARQMIAAVQGAEGWGRFDVRLSGERLLLRVVEQMMNWRSRLTGIATGDQGIFVSRELFERIGGFADLPLMEDVDLSRRLKRQRWPICLRDRLITSSRRWEHKGPLRTIGLMWYLRLAYFLGVPPARIATYYDQST